MDFLIHNRSIIIISFFIAVYRRLKIMKTEVDIKEIDPLEPIYDIDEYLDNDSPFFQDKY